MAYDRDLAERIRDLLGERPDVTEMAMFGGLAFLVNGHMAVAASGQGGALVRVDPADADAPVYPAPKRAAALSGVYLRIARWAVGARKTAGGDDESAE